MKVVHGGDTSQLFGSSGWSPEVTAFSSGAQRMQDKWTVELFRCFT
jgi:hypothetical protein